MTAADRAYDRIRSNIIAGKYPALAHLREQSLAEEIGLSRTPIREALRRLANEGFLDFSPQYGAFVPSWGSERVAQLYDVRAMLESECAELAARRMTDAIVSELEALAQKMEGAVARGAAALDELGQLNRTFHETVMTASGNERLKVATLQAIEQLPVLHRSYHRYEPEQWQRSMRHHREIIDAFTVRDANWARAIMCAHILAGKYQISRTRSSYSDSQQSDAEPAPAT